MEDWEREHFEAMRDLWSRHADAMRRAAAVSLRQADDADRRAAYWAGKLRGTVLPDPGPPRQVRSDSLRAPTALQAVVLEQLGRDWVTCQQIADRLGRPYPWVYGKLIGLVDRGLVERTPADWKVRWRRTVDVAAFDAIVAPLSGLGDGLNRFYDDGTAT